jgi:protein-disulfide isomerase
MAVFLDLQSPHTEAILPILRQLVTAFPQQLRVVIKLYPGRERALAREVNEAAVAAMAQGKFWDVVDEIVKARDSLTLEALRAIMEKAGMDLAKYDEAMSKSEGRSILVDDFGDARRGRVRTAPAVFVNGKPVGGMNQEQLTEAVKNELEGAKQ